VLQINKNPNGGKGRLKGSKNKKTPELQALLAPHVKEVVDELVKIAKTGKTEQVRVSAGNAILDRVYGRAPQAIAVSTGPNALAELLGEIDGITRGLPSETEIEQERLQRLEVEAKQSLPHH
tara:strand:+ start:232 stop:597 length:366 start_codon:yes stop_codon:yes gene_type:complete